MRYPQVEWGKKNKFLGYPIFYLFGKAKFGDNIMFISHSKYNMVGLSKRCTIHVSKSGKLEIGNCSGFSGVSIYCSKFISIGAYCNFGGNVSIWDTDFHSLHFEKRRENDDLTAINSSPIIIGDDVFVGANSIILKGVSIGNKAIIGAGSVVTKNIPAGQIWAGNPARFIRNI